MNKLKTLPLSLFDCSKIDLTKYTDEIGELFVKVCTEMAQNIDKERVKDIICKAKLYDEAFNPYTVDKHYGKLAIKQFVNWVLYKITDNDLSKDEIINLLRLQLEGDFE